MTYFSEDELRCRCGCGEYKFNPQTLDRLNALRGKLHFSMTVSSGYRCEAYNERMGYTQTHATGQAVDIKISHEKAYRLLAIAPIYGFTGIGINQKGSDRFIHLDDLPEELNRPRPHIWSY